MRIGKLALLATGLCPWLAGCALKFPASFDSQLSGAASGKTAAPDILTMIAVPANTTGFLMGSNALGGISAPEHTVQSISAFTMAKYEVQYGDWLTVKTWAASNGYSFANPGQKGNDGLKTNQDPVTFLNWRDAIIWCNAASEKQGLTPVYFTDASFSAPLKTSTNGGAATGAGQEDNPYVNWSATGYRLPTEVEWEYAARYIDGTTFMRGDAPSGWQDNNTANLTVDNLEINAVAWSSNNASSATHPVGAKTANALGLLDMTGNVNEWVWDWMSTYAAVPPYTDPDSKGAASGGTRVFRGFSWLDALASMQSSNRTSASGSPGNTFVSVGFRPVRRP